MVGEEITDLKDFKEGDIVYITTVNYANKPVRVRRIIKGANETLIAIGENKRTMFSWENFLSGRSWIRSIKRFKK